MDERRLNERFTLHQMIEISLDHMEYMVSAQITDISLGGIKCLVKNPIDTSSDLYLMFEIPENDKTRLVKCYGEVSWLTKESDKLYSTGIQFKFLTSQDKEVLLKFIETLQS